MNEKPKTSASSSPIAWVLRQTGRHGGQYVLAVVLAVIGVLTAWELYRRKKN